MKKLLLPAIMALVILLPALPLIGFSGGIYGSNSGEELYVIVEEIRPGGVCLSPNDDNGVYALHGWTLASTPLTYKINRDSVPRGVDKGQALVAIQTAANAWDGKTAASLFSYGGTTTAKAGKRDGVNAVSFGGAYSGAIAVAYIWQRDGKVLEADMVLSTAFKWAIGIQEDSSITSDDCLGVDNRMDVQDIATHEFGHWIGVAHTSNDASNNAQTMFPYASYKELFKQSLADGDITGLQYLYGS